MASRTHRPRIIIVGAGIGGLSAAATLASGGCDVTVFEQLDRPGGKMGEIREHGYRWDTGPSVITMRHVLDRLFKHAGRRLSDYVELLPLQPITRYFWPDGVRLDAVADQAEMCEQIRAIAPRDVDGYVRFMRYAKRLHDIVGEPFLYRARPSLRDLLRLPLADTLRIDALRSMHTAIKAHFRDPHLVQLFDRFATYNGSSPYKAPATLNVIAHVEMAGGAWYPRGGVYALATAMARLATDLGADIRFSHAVRSITPTGATGYTVTLADGQTAFADAVVINADYSVAQNALLPRAASDQTTERRLEPSCSALAMLLAVESQHETLAHHNIFFCQNYRDEFDALFNSLTPPADPTLYVCITSKTDPDHAPAGCENWFVLANAPHLSDRFDWTTQGATYAENLKALLANRLTTAGIEAPPIAHERHLTPQHVQRWYGGNRGALYGFSSNSRLAAFMRPPNRSHRLGKLYYASGSVHPGGGVPLVTLSGMAAAHCVLEDFALDGVLPTRPDSLA